MKNSRFLLSIPTAAAVGVGYWAVVTGRATVDLGWGRRTRPLGPFTVEVAAPAEIVFDVISEPYLGRTTRALSDKLRVLERSPAMVLAEHYTPVGAHLRAVTVETVVFERPRLVSFRLLRGPVPHVVETFELDERAGLTALSYSGEMGTDLGQVGAWWGRVVADKWEGAVRDSFANVKQEAERRAR